MDTRPPWGKLYWDVWLAWVEEFKAQCPYCGLDGSVLENWRQMETEHIIPSGVDKKINLTVACHACNKTKSNWNPDTQSFYDPSLNGLTVPTDEVAREMLLTRAREYVLEKWKAGDYSVEIHARMMDEGSGRT